MPSTLTITCPYCQKTISLDEALSHDVEDKYKKDFDEKLLLEKSKIEKEIQLKTETKVKQTLEQEMKNTREDLAEQKLRNKQLLEQLTETNRLIRDLKRKDEERQLEMDKKLVLSEEKIRQEALKKATEEQYLKILEKDKQLQNALKETDELKRKLQQGSQQGQGEVLELELEKILTQEFPNDKISPVGKGVRGADVIQEIWDRTGIKCGVILWESKNAKWNENWIDKLKEDQRNLKAEMGALVSEQLPKDIKSAAYRNGIWVTHRNFVIGMAMALRANLIQASYIRRSFKGKNDKKEFLWTYLTGTEFTQRMEIILEAFNSMKIELDKEKEAFTKIWAKREKQIERVINTTIGLRGDLEEVTGNALPPIKNLELPESED